MAPAAEAASPIGIANVSARHIMRESNHILKIFLAAPKPEVDSQTSRLVFILDIVNPCDAGTRSWPRGELPSRLWYDA